MRAASQIYVSEMPLFALIDGTIASLERGGYTLRHVSGVPSKCLSILHKCMMLARRDDMGTTLPGRALSSSSYVRQKPLGHQRMPCVQMGTRLPAADIRWR